MTIIVTLIAYIGSIALAFEIGRVFGVLDFSDFFIYGMLALSFPIVVSYLMFRENKGFLIALPHFFLGVIIHPAVQFKDLPYLSGEEQLSLLQRTHQSGISWHAHADVALVLARSLKADALMRLELASPVAYWVFPPSMVLLFWGLIFFFFLPKIETWLERSANNM